MAHARALIRAGFATALSSVSVTGGRVYSGAIYPFETAELPNVALSVAHEPETAIDNSEMGNIDLRELPVLVTGRAIGGEGMEDTLDEIALGVERALTGSATLKGLLVHLQLVSTEIEFDVDGEAPTGEIRMVWATLYRCNRTAPDSAIL